MYGGLCVGLAETIGPVIGGVIIHKRRVSTRDQLRLIIVMMATSTVFLLLLLAVNCHDAGFVWQNTTVTYGSFFCVGYTSFLPRDACISQVCPRGFENGGPTDRIKLAFHGADTDTDTDSTPTRPTRLYILTSDMREDPGEDVGVRVGVVECQL